MMRKLLCGLALALGAATVVAPRSATACGGCFSPPPPTPMSAQVVTDHRMVLAVSHRQTTLWDQIRYAGSPEDFVWVLPVANAATLRFGLGDDNFVEALDNYTAPTITANLPSCFGGSGRGAGGPRADASSGLFIGCGGSASFSDASNGAGTESTRISREGEAVVGPYAVNIIGSKAGGGQLDTWLESHGFLIPASTRAAIAYYVDLQFDFIILRLAPGAGVQQMQPVRITTRGYSPILPLRMVAAGIGDKVGLTLMVVAESRMQAQNFANAVIDEGDLTFDFRTNRSNWRQVYDQTLRSHNGRVWITESAQNLFELQLNYRTGWGMTRGNDAGTSDDGGPLGDADPFGLDALAPDPDAGLFSDAGTSTDPDADVLGALDGGGGDGGAMVMNDAGAMEPAADPFVDRRFAFSGLEGRAVITRLRTELGAVDLDRDLILDASSDGLIPVEYVAGTLLNGPVCPQRASCSIVGASAPAVLEVLGVVAIVLQVRRRRRRARTRDAA